MTEAMVLSFVKDNPAAENTRATSQQRWRYLDFERTWLVTPVTSFL